VVGLQDLHCGPKSKSVVLGVHNESVASKMVNDNYSLPWDVLGRDLLELHILNLVPGIKDSQVVREDFQHQANTLVVVEEDHVSR
jgi:hypothetical protein